ncbi:secretion protein HlyD [Arthrobacter sp. TPD3018]|jgi:multidrug resistance efflux pump|uniref:HlyD family secretion protein n=1 Tax=Bacteria TaxID=2 RepID=UPI000D520785|nr:MULTISPECIES: HlyD family secretion protein [Bacteria]PVE55719.1 secretion protein HlyD [Sphingomonas sp. TPD3009]PVE57458.1 secretion protein HlyD [Arthrobacter sp. TPD3018]PVE83085.1 secretion protein HlyD [Sphingomonas melonis]RTL20845.1 MAG: HlyD family secretion protein [Sphingomonadaceae bacterium]
MTDIRNPVDSTPATEEAQAEAATPPSAPSGSGWRPQPPSRTAMIVIAILAIGGVLAVLAAWRLPPFATANQSTDNAYVRGRTTVIAPQVSGYVTKVYVRDFADVTAGQPLVQIDDRIYRQRVDQATAQVDAQNATLANAQQTERSRTASLAAQTAAVANAEAQLMRAQADMNRVNDLVTDGSVSQRERDQTLAALRQAQAAVQQARAAREIAQQDIRTVQVGRGGQRAGVSGAEAARRLAQIDLANTVIRAPEAGRLSEVGVRVGQYVTAGSQLMFLVPPETWVIANFKEAQTARMAVGQPATFTVDGLAGAKLTGRVERISPAAGSEFAVLKADNATGNFTKVPQRIAVRIRIDPGQQLIQRLRPGMSVQASVDTTTGPTVK